LAQEGSFSGALYFFDGSQKGLRFFASIVKQAALFVGPSTGTTHIANGFDVPLVALYSPLSVQGVVRWGPWRGETKKQVRAYTPSKEASGLKNPMETIMVAEILKSAVELLSNSF
jgi:ADP-heptose:LPS heptosyltransferase